MENQVSKSEANISNDHHQNLNYRGELSYSNPIPTIFQIGKHEYKLVDIQEPYFLSQRRSNNLPP